MCSVTFFQDDHGSYGCVILFSMLGVSSTLELRPDHSAVLVVMTALEADALQNTAAGQDQEKQRHG